MIKCRKIAVLILALTVMALFVGCNERRLPVLTLDKQNGEPLEQVELRHFQDTIYNSAYNGFSNPTREGWFFDGWFFDKDCTQSANGILIDKDTTIYAGWTDTVQMESNGYAPWNVSFKDMFTLSATAVPYGIDGEVLITLSVTANGDFTGENSSDSFSMQFSYNWLSDETYLGEYTSDECVAYACESIYLEKENNFSVKDFKIIVAKNNTSNVYPTTFNNTRTEVVITYIFGSPTLQYRHN